MGVVESFNVAVGNIVAFLPTLVAAIIILVIAWIAGRAVGKLVSAGLDKAGVDDALRKTAIGKSIESRRTGTASEVPYMGIFSMAIQVFLYFIVIIVALDQLKINTSIIYVFATALAWGIAVGAGVGLGIAFGFGLKDRIPRLLEGVSGEETKKRLQKIEEAAHSPSEPLPQTVR